MTRISHDGYGGGNAIIIVAAGVAIATGKISGLSLSPKTSVVSAMGLHGSLSFTNPTQGRSGFQSSLRVRTESFSEQEQLRYVRQYKCPNSRAEQSFISVKEREAHSSADNSHGWCYETCIEPCDPSPGARTATIIRRALWFPPRVVFTRMISYRLFPPPRTPSQAVHVLNRRSVVCDSDGVRYQEHQTGATTRT